MKASHAQRRIANIENVKTMDASLRARYLAEAKFSCIFLLQIKCALP